MTESTLRGLAASGGIAAGEVLVVRDLEPETNGGGEAQQERALEALALVAEELARLAGVARAAGRAEEADILDANRLMADDPALRDDVRERAAQLPAETAVLRATARFADLLAELDDPMLASRAADVRQLGRRAARQLRGGGALAPPGEPAIVLARDLGPADVAELELAAGRVLGIALAEGAATSHVAIMARSLGVPMVVGLGEGVLAAADGTDVVLDGDDGVLVLAPGAEARRRAATSVQARERERRRLAAGRGLPAVTRDGRRIRLLCNAAGPADVAAGLAAGAEGVGLLRTELAFLESTSWPTESEHAAALEPVLAALGGRLATVRTLDFGADKTPPFLAGVEERGLALMLAHPEAMLAQLRALARVGRAAQLRVMLPMVESAEQLEAVRALLPEPWPLGAMIETPEAAERAGEIAAVADFISIGTNDLVQYTLGLDRELPLASAQAAAHPTVLGHIARVVEAAHAEGLSVEVCGEAAGEPPVVALLVGLGVDELSVAPARLDVVRETVRGVAFSGEAGDERGEALDGLGSVRA